MAFSTTPFYHSHTRNIIIAFGVLFRDIKVIKPDLTEITVPIAYGSKQKWFERLRKNPNLDNLPSTILPRIGFSIEGYEYDAERKTSSLGQHFKPHATDVDSYRRTYEPIPWNMVINLSVWAKTIDDGLQIIEQIIPFFKPSFNITIQELHNDFEYKKDIPIILNSVTMVDDFEGTFAGFRISQWDLTFTVKMNMHGPLSTQPVIKHVYIDRRIPLPGEELGDADNSETVDRQYTTIDPIESTIVDEYTILQTLELFPEGDTII